MRAISLLAALPLLLSLAGCDEHSSGSASRGSHGPQSFPIKSNLSVEATRRKRIAEFGRAEVKRQPVSDPIHTDY